ERNFAWPADHEDVLENMKLSETTGLWSVDLSQIISSRQTQNEQKWALRWFSKNYKVVQLKAVNSRGYAVIDSSQTEFGTTPTENVVNAQKEGPIYLSFCLVHSPQAVCGLGLMGHKQEGHKADLTPLGGRIVVALLIAIGKTSSFAESSHTTLQHVIHEINMGPGCHVRLIDPYGGTAGSGMPFKDGYSKEPLPRWSSAQKLALSWNCIPHDSDFVKGLAVRFDEAQIDG
ncbi:hypothetical protein Q9L58_010921, partial [Maublancomyces gigas]